MNTSLTLLALSSAIPSGYDSSSGRRVYELSYGEKDPVIPAALRDLPNLAFSKQPEYDIRPERYVESGSKISITEAYSLRLDDEAGFGTVGFAAVLEDNLGTRRHVLSTVGHVIDDASTINVQGADESKYDLEPVPECRRELGCPRFRRNKEDVSGPISLNQICLLETSAFPSDLLRCVFPSIDCCRIPSFRR